MDVEEVDNEVSTSNHKQWVANNVKSLDEAAVSHVSLSSLKYTRRDLRHETYSKNSDSSTTRKKRVFIFNQASPHLKRSSDSQSSALLVLPDHIDTKKIFFFFIKCV